uniref:F-box domain-containing protein n=1 Tax=Steinernema glaseri TaxID=37863 RepID=A0A1I7ZR96_9BILA
MEYIPYEFVKDVLTLVDQPCPFLELSGQWRRVAEKRRETPTSLFFRRSPEAPSTIEFAFGHDDLWRAFKNREPVTCFVQEIRFLVTDVEQFMHLSFYPLDAENISLLTGSLEKSTHRVRVLLKYSSFFDAVIVKPLLLSIPRISELISDVFACDHSLFSEVLKDVLACDHSLSHELFKKAVHQGTLETYEARKDRNFNDDDYLKATKEFVACRRMKNFIHVLPKHRTDEGSFLIGVLEAWIAKENCNEHTLLVERSFLPLVERVMTEQGFEALQQEKPDAVVLQKGAKRLTIRVQYGRAVSLVEKNK